MNEDMLIGNRLLNDSMAPMGKMLVKETGDDVKSSSAAENDNTYKPLHHPYLCMYMGIHPGTTPRLTVYLIPVQTSHGYSH